MTDSSRYGIAPAKQRFKIVSWNVNGLRSLVQNPGLLDTYISQEAPDALFMQETKLSDNGSQFAKLVSGYTGYFNSCTLSDKKGYSGVALFAKRIPYKVTYGIGKRDMDKEGRVLTAEYEKFYIVGSYVPNSGDGLRRLEFRATQWDVALREYIKSLESKKPVILCGDLNVAHQDRDIYDCLKTYNKYAGNTKEEKENFTELLKLGYVDAFRALYPYRTQYSYWGYRHNMKESNRGWRLDYFVVSNKLLDVIDDSCMRDKVPGSDHCPIVLTLLTGKETRNSPIIVPPLPLTPVPIGYKGPRRSKSKGKTSKEDSMKSTEKRKSIESNARDKIYPKSVKEKSIEIEEEEDEEEEEENEENEDYIPSKSKRGPYKKHKRWYKKRVSTKKAGAVVAGAAGTGAAAEYDEEEEEEEEKSPPKKVGTKGKKRWGGRRIAKVREEIEDVEITPIKINDDVEILPSSVSKKIVHTGWGIVLTSETMIINAEDYEKAKANSTSNSHSRRPSVIEENTPIRLMPRRRKKNEPEVDEMEEEEEPTKVVKKKGRKSKAERIAEELERIATEAEAEAKAKEKERAKQKQKEKEKEKEKIKIKSPIKTPIKKKTIKKEVTPPKAKYVDRKPNKKSAKNPYEKKIKHVVSYKETKTYHKHSEDEKLKIKTELSKEQPKTKRPYHFHTRKPKDLSKLEVETPTKRPYHRRTQSEINKAEEQPKAKRPYHFHTRKPKDSSKTETEKPTKRPYHRHTEINEKYLQELPLKRPYHWRSKKAKEEENKEKETAEEENNNSEEKKKGNKRNDDDDIVIPGLEEPSPYQVGRRGRKSNAQLEEEWRIYEEKKRKILEEVRKKKETENNGNSEESQNNKINTENQQKDNNNSNNNSNNNKATTSDFFQQTDFVRVNVEDRIKQHNENMSKEKEKEKEKEVNNNSQNIQDSNTNTNQSSSSNEKGNEKEKEQPKQTPISTSKPLSMSSLLAFLSSSAANINGSYNKDNQSK